MAEQMGALELARLRRGLTQREIAGQLGVTQQTLSGYEAGRYRPRPARLVKLAEAYGLSLEEVLAFYADRSAS